MGLFELINREECEQLLENITSRYQTFFIPKKSGKPRKISAPEPELKEAQRVLTNFINEYPLRNSVVGFRPRVSLLQGATAHLGQGVLLNMDLKDFFPSCRGPALYKAAYKVAMWAEYNDVTRAWSQEELQIFVGLVSLYGRLPQGAPTSPMFANIVFEPVDIALEQFCQEHDLVYSRYADDLTFSHKDPKFDIGKLIKPIHAIIVKYGFLLNFTKTRIARKHRRMQVTGVVVNTVASVPQYKYRNFRARVHQLYLKSERPSKAELNQLRGYTTWLKQVKNHGCEPKWLITIQEQLQDLCNR